MSSSTPNDSTQKIGQLLNQKATQRGLVISRVRVRMQNKSKQDQKGKKEKRVSCKICTRWHVLKESDDLI